MRLTGYFLLVLSLTYPFNTVFASADDDFKQGVEYVKKEQYKKAIQAFGKAQQQGMKTAALYHNMGVSYFKSGDYTNAYKTFQLLARFPGEKMLAEYNMGLTARQQDNTALATRHFQLVKSQSKNKKLVTLARIQLGEVKLTDPAPVNKGTAYAEFSYGHDNNIAADPDTGAATKLSSTYKDIYVDGQYIVYGTENNGLNVNAAYSSFDYSDYNIYDFDSLAFGVTGNFELGGWQNALKVKSEKTGFGLLDYQRVNQFELDTKKQFANNSRLRLRLRFYDITALNTTYSYLEGSKTRLRLEYKHPAGGGYLKYYVEHEANDRTDTLTTSYSPTRNMFKVYYKHDFSKQLDLRVDASYRVSDYPTKVNPGREDKRQRYGLTLSYNLNDTWKLRGRLEHTDNASTDAALYSYQRDLVAVSVNAGF